MSDKGRKRQQMHAMWPQYNSYPHPMVPPPYGLPCSLPPNYGLYVPQNNGMNPNAGPPGPQGFSSQPMGFSQHHSSVGFNQASVMQHMNIASISSNTKMSVSSLSSSIGATMIHEVVAKDKGVGGAESIKMNDDGTLNVSVEKFNELTRLALRGSELAEKIAYNHRNRPCFKKIDSLCARMKQDLIRPDGVLPNINSQGIAWAVKDIIFVFTRVINAWIVIKGYVYNTPEGMSKVQENMSPDFQQNFVQWQDATKAFVESLIQSFVNLDNLVTSQKNMHHSNKFDVSMTSSPMKLHPTAPVLEDPIDLFESNSAEQRNGINRNYMYTMIEDSEDSQRQATMNGTYFKTGTYNPIKKNQFNVDCGSTTTTSSSNTSGSPPNTMASASGNRSNDDYNSVNCEISGGDGSISAYSASVEKTEYQQQSESSRQNEQNENNSAKLVNVESSPPYTGEFDDSKLTEEDYLEASKMLEEFFDDQLSTFFSLGDSHVGSAEQFLKQKLPEHWLDYGMKIFEQTYADRNTLGTNKPIEGNSNDSDDVGNNITLLMAAIMGMKSIDLFFNQHFTKNYFPQFTEVYKYEILDLRTIFNKVQNGEYNHIYEMVHDIRAISHFARKFLKTNSDSTLEKSTKEFELEFNSLLRRFPFNQLRFDHITGDPKETLKKGNL